VFTTEFNLSITFAEVPGQIEKGTLKAAEQTDETEMLPEDAMDYLYALAFWFIEGYLFSYEIDSEKFPTLSYYLNERSDYGLPRRWELWCNLVDTSELEPVVSAWQKTRRHALETLAETPLEEKKSA